MSWALIQDKDNLLRTGEATLDGNPAPLPGTHPRAMYDGAVVIPYATPGTGTWQEITFSGPAEPTIVCVHDFRAVASAEVEIAGVPVTADEISRGNFFRWGDAETLEIRVRTASSWSIGEVVIARWDDVVRADGDAEAPETHRSHVQTQTWNVVENGPWRTKMAEPRRRWELSFAPAREERLQRIYEDAGGGLRPVVFLPWVVDASGPEVMYGEPIHGHLDSEFTSNQQLGGLWAEGRVLAVTESQRRLR